VGRAGGGEGERPGWGGGQGGGGFPGQTERNRKIMKKENSAESTRSRSGRNSSIGGKKGIGRNEGRGRRDMP